MVMYGHRRKKRRISSLGEPQGARHSEATLHSPEASADRTWDAAYAARAPRQTADRDAIPQASPLPRLRMARYTRIAYTGDSAGSSPVGPSADSIRSFVMADSSSDPRTNQLLAALPEPEWTRWKPQLALVEMPLGQVLYESGGTLSHVYFPTTAIVSLLYVMENGASAEIAVVGNEGIVGISLFMGGESTPSRAVVQSAGQGYRLKAEVIKHEFNRATGAASPAALHPGPDHPDGADGRLQPASFARPATVPLAAPQHGPPAGQRADDDAGVDREHARSPSRRRHRRRAQACRRRGSSATRAVTSRCSTAQAWSSAPASAMRWSRRSTTASCRTGRRLNCSRPGAMFKTWLSVGPPFAICEGLRTSPLPSQRSLWPP